MTTYVTPKVNTAYKFYVGLIDQSNTKLLKANPTIASGDFKVSTDGGAFANLATLPSANPASGRAVMIDLSASEMNGANIVVQCVDAAGAEWCDLMVNIQTSARQVDDLAFPATTGRSMVVDASGLVDANTVKVGPSGSGTAQTAGDVGVKTGFALSATGSAALTEAYAADGATPTLNQMLYQIWAFLAEKNVSGTTLTAKKLDGSTTAMTFTLDSSSAPTSITRAT